MVSREALKRAWSWRSVSRSPWLRARRMPRMRVRARARRPRGRPRPGVLLGVKSLKRLWWTPHDPDAPELQPSAALEAILDGGSQVGELARGYVPGGSLIDVYPPHLR